ncbi:site-specific integrase [Streptococcus dysgalactiae]|uniref:Site-specific integrase n=1 Tax=Streptococcus dysgalactiae TaxID=1334 RepID=A0AAE9ULS4_STRDY|nr:site-specific integrase [Streptococcus dysgalactiae]QGH03870.1 site-specific integrase [Streptococcus dysgalactiae subsp. dysgalactiae]WAI92973.1 site-specific integrase [Streptococcus dysgalactiae]BBE41248.1 transposase from transposon Tn916 [Streptococcus dysgalactiae]
MAKYRKRGKTWYYRIYYIDIQGEKREKTKGGFKTKALATAAAVKAEAELNKGNNNEDITLYDFCKEWSEIYKRPHVVDKTWETYTKNLKHIKKYFGDIKLNKVTHTLYQKKMNVFASKYAQETLEKFHYQIKGAANVAVRDGLIKTNFAEGAIVKSQKEARAKEFDFLEEDEYLNLIKVTSEKYQYISYFTLYIIAVTGLRFAEATGITWNDIDFEKGFIDINKSFDYSKTQEFKETKNEQSKRQIPIDQQTIKLLRAFKANHYKENKLNRVLYGASNSLCNRLVKKIVGRPVRNHSLRHTYASFLILKGVDLISISQLLGHENLNITLKVYAHQLDKLKERNNQVIKDIFGNLTDF